MKSIAILQRHKEQMPSCERAIAFLAALKAQVCRADNSATGDTANLCMFGSFFVFLVNAESANDRQTGRVANKPTII